MSERDYLTGAQAAPIIDSMHESAISRNYPATLLAWCGVWLLVLALILAAREAALDSPLLSARHPAPLQLLPAPGAVLQESASQVAPRGATPAEALDLLERAAQRQLRGRIPASAPPERIAIPSIGLDAPVEPVGWQAISLGGVSVVQWEVAEYAAGWHQDSALPGHLGNIVLAGHHNIKGEVFRDLIDLKEGDVITLTAEGRAYRYQVATLLVLRERGMPLEVRQENARWIAPTTQERLTLVTCWPYASNTHRVIVLATPVAD